MRANFKIPAMRTEIASLCVENAALRESLAQAGITLPINTTPPMPDDIDSRHADNGPCHGCTFERNWIVNRARFATEDYFDGLCRLHEGDSQPRSQGGDRKRVLEGV
jgi:hypothetical protein